MQKPIKILLSVIVILIMTITAFAQTPQPTEVQITGLPDGMVRMVQTYRLDLDADMDNCIPETFEDESYHYTREEMTVTEITVIDVQEVSLEKSQSASHRLRAADFSETIEYELDEYRGTLSRDDATFSVAGTGTKNASKKVTATKKHAGLGRNDMSQVDKTYQGLTLVLVDWYDQNTGQSVKGFTDGTPGPYSAVAHYRGYKTSKVTTGYAAYVTYRGTVEKQTVTANEVTVTYIGTTIPSSKNFLTAPFIFTALGVGLIGGLICFGIWFFRRRKQ